VSTATAAKIDSGARPSRRRRNVRRLVRGVMLIAAVLLLLSASNESSPAVVVPALSPLTAIASLLTTRTLHAVTWIGLSVAAVALIRRRWFCRWVCPTGTCADCAAMLGKRLHRRAARLPRLGQWIALLTLGGAALGYPMLLWLDPLALFSGLFGVFHAEATPAIAWCATGMAAILAMSLIWPGAWCARICPLGALHDLLSRLARRVRFAFARRSEHSGEKPAGRLSRRIVLGALAGALWATVARRVRGAAARPLRPPGAVDEARFVGLCIRCGNCLRACPTHIIRPDQGERGIAGLMTPVLDFSHDYCTEGCTRCTHVCPSGALVPLEPEAKQRTSIGLPHVDMNVCLLGDDRDCSMCRNWCPYGAIKLVWSEEEYTLTPQVDLDKCPGCGACETVCPTTPQKAIVIRPAPRGRQDREPLPLLHRHAHTGTVHQ